MENNIIRKTRENIFLILALIWILLWIFPWAMWLDSLPWIRLGIGIILFATPGTVVSLFLTGKKLSLLSHFISGLALSVFFVGSLGLLGRVFHLPFSYLKPIFALSGLIGFLAISKYSHSEKQLFKPQNFSIASFILLLSLIIFAMIASFQYRFTGDNFSYLAYLTNWQHAQPLNFHEIIFGLTQYDSVRFWFAMFPMNLAFLADISNLHGLLLIGFYLGPYLVSIAILSTYNLYEDFLKSEGKAITALLLHFTFLFLLRGGFQAGLVVFDGVTMDKAFAAFILAPVFFLAIYHFLDSYTFPGAIFILLSGLSLALTHPVILAYSIFIAGIYSIIITTAIKKDYKKLGLVVVILMATILPSASLRFAPASSKVAFNLESTMETVGIANNNPLISYIDGTPFYGFNLERIKVITNQPKAGNPFQTFFSWSYVWLLGLGFLWSVFNLRKNTIAPFIAATSFLVLLCAIPYTGWVMGYAVSPRMLYRSTWLLPIGLFGTVVFVEFFEFIFSKISLNNLSRISGERVAFGLILSISLILIGYFSIYVYRNKWQLIAEHDTYENKLENLSSLGNYLETNIEPLSIFLAPPELRDYLPGLSSKSKVIFFRTQRFTPYSVNITEINSIFSQNTSISLKQRINILIKYHVDYILVENRSLEDYYASYPEFFHVQAINNFLILKFQKTSP